MSIKSQSQAVTETSPFSTQTHDIAMERIHAVINAGPYKPEWDSLRVNGLPAWYQNGKFGIFIHWGPSSTSGFRADWYARDMYRPGTAEFEYHRKTYGSQDTFGYKDLIDRYTMEKFDPDEWASLFRKTGAQFVVPLAEYHDGYAEYDSQFTEWKATLRGPKRDLLGDLFKSLRKVGITPGCSSHYAENWWFFNGGVTFESDVQDPTLASLYGPAQREEVPPNEEWMRHWLCRTCDFVDKYQPELVWFDGCFNGIEQPAFQPWLQLFTAYYFNVAAKWGKHVAINYKHFSFPDDVGVRDFERGQLSDIHYPFWQTDTALARNTWIHIPDAIYKQAATVIGDLVDIVSKNGALLLNIGPRPDGSIPEAERALLEDIGAWLAINGEAIYKTHPWKIFGEGPSKIKEGHFTDTHRAPYTSADIRFTQRKPERIHEDILYATILAPPTDNVARIKCLAEGCGLLMQDIRRVDLLGGENGLCWQRTPEGRIVTLPDKLPTKNALVLRLILEPKRVHRRLQEPTHENGPSYDS